MMSVYVYVYLSQKVLLTRYFCLKVALVVKVKWSRDWLNHLTSYSLVAESLSTVSTLVW